MGNRAIGLGATLCGLGARFGAFGTHLLREALEPRALGVYETAVLYQLVHGLGLIAIGAAWRDLGCPHRAAWTVRLMSLGVVVFSGSLYALALTGERRFGMLAPIGGALLIVSWGVFAVNAFLGRSRRSADGNG